MVETRLVACQTGQAPSLPWVNLERQRTGSNRNSTSPLAPLPS